MLAAASKVVLDPAHVPVHCEAYPSFLVKGVLRRWREDARRCEWHDESHGLAAQMDLKSCSNSQLQIYYSCGSDTDRRQRGADFLVVMHPQISRGLEPRTFCPVCRTVKQRMFFRGKRWACQQCQGLVERRGLLGPREKAIIRREKLIIELYARYQPIRSPATDAYKRQELRELEAELGSHASARLPPPLAHVLTPVWIGAEDVQYERHNHESGPAYLDLALPSGLRG